MKDEDILAEFVLLRFVPIPIKYKLKHILKILTGCEYLIEFKKDSDD